MLSTLIGTHAFVGEVGFLLFLWVFVELLSPTPDRIKRATFIVFLGTLAFFASWFIGGYYYVTFYGGGPKLLIKGGPIPWAHDIFTETKEHIFLFLPLLSIYAFALLKKYKDEILQKPEIKKALILLVGIIIFIGLAMAGMGYVISVGVRTALEVNNVIQ